MKVLVKFYSEYYLVTKGRNDSETVDNLFHRINENRWPDECIPQYVLEEEMEVIAYFTDNSEIIE
jgi:hypothetical protein